ncbi:hypothetical protein [Desertibacillus haloalkaliphilus]|uniref:hypothetical protein n=1 Tax=Desertibacillus haloalkaliphilus TaxID=1328930 RepID=UPI001C27338B|nr:hypothetical protein [Desertibacillus haloalkaliphilus]MBU8907905.1 hypothetical protein [Desertibacillus haloalkaliphilus]
MNRENEQATETERSKADTSRELDGRQRLKRKLIYGLGSVILWGGLVYGGYYFIHSYLEEVRAEFDDKIDNVLDQNEEIVTELEQFTLEIEATTDELAIIKDELSYIHEGLELTGETITGSDETRLALQERIVELDDRLNDLQSQLVKLEEATRAH